MTIPAWLRVTDQPLWTDALSWYPWEPGLARRFTVASRLEGQEPIVLYARQEIDGEPFIGLPWHCCPIAEDDRRTQGLPMKIVSKVVPRDDDQARAIQQTKDFLDQGLSGVLKAPTGEGKTVMCCDVLAHYGRSTLVVPPKDDLIDQWIERLLEFTNLVPGQIGRVQGDTCRFKGLPIVLGSLRSICKPNRYPKDLYTAFGLLVGDEVHRWGADQMGMIVKLFAAQQRLGLSATPGRADGRDLQVECHVGPIRVTKSAGRLTAKVFQIRTGWKVPRGRDGSQLPHKAGRLGLILKPLYANTHRNRQIVKFTMDAYSKGRRIVVFGDHTEPLEMLELHFLKAGVPASEIGRYYGSKLKGAALKAEGKKRLILATYQKMGEGTDIPELDTCILTGPRSDVEQIVGRVLRIHPDKKPPIIGDFIDDDSPVLRRYAQGRERFYKSKGFTLIQAEIQLD